MAFLYICYMSTVVDPFIKNLNKVKKSIPRYANMVIMEHSEIIIARLTDTQLAYGLNSRGSIVGTYKPYTRKMAYQDKQSSNGRYPITDKEVGQPYNFQWTGELFESLNLKGDASSNEYEIFSVKGKLKFLESEFNTKLSNLTEENNKWVNENILMPKIYQHILNEMFMGLI